MVERQRASPFARYLQVEDTGTIARVRSNSVTELTFQGAADTHRRCHYVIRIN